MAPLPRKKRPSSHNQQISSKYSPPKSPQKSPLKKSPMKSPVKEHPANMIDQQRKHVQQQQQLKRPKRTLYANSRGLEESEDSDAMDVDVEEIGTGEKTHSFTAATAAGNALVLKIIISASAVINISSHQQEKQQKTTTTPTDHKRYSVKAVSAVTSSAQKKQQLAHNLPSPQKAQYSKIDNKTNSNSKNSAQHINAPLSSLSCNKTAIDGNETVCSSDPFDFGESSKMNLSAAKKDYVSKSKRKECVASSTGSIGQRPPTPYVHATTLIEEHQASVYAVSFNQFIKYGATTHFFATVGTNKISIYSCLNKSDKIKSASNDGSTKLVRHFVDTDAPDEVFYAVTWAYYGGDMKAHAIVAGGERGVIRVLAPQNGLMFCPLLGHGSAIYELRTSPTNPMIIASASRDMTARLWNIQRSECLAILGGRMGHNDALLSLDFNKDSTYLATSGMDHNVNLWNIGADTEIGRKIEESMNSLDADSQTNIKQIYTAAEHFPDSKSHDLHTNYVDCVRILGDFIVSKSCENQIVLWKFGGFEWNMPFMNRILKVMDGIAGNRTNNRNVPIETFAAQTAFLHLPDSQEWFNKFAIDPFNEFIACGNRSGEVHIWRLRKEEFDFPSKNSDYVIPAHHIGACARQVAFSPDSSIMIVVADQGFVARFDLRQEERERIDARLKADIAMTREPTSSGTSAGDNLFRSYSNNIKSKPRFVFNSSPFASTVSRGADKFAKQSSPKEIRHVFKSPVKKQQQTPQQQLPKSPRYPTRSSISSGKTSPLKSTKQTAAGQSASSSAMSIAPQSTTTTPINVSGRSRKQQPTVTRKTRTFGAESANLTSTKRGN